MVWPERDEVRVVLVRPERLDPSALAERCDAWLAEDERSRFRRIQPTDVRHEYLVTRALCRHVLGEALGVEPPSLRFALGPYGRPELVVEALPEAAQARASELSFNLSNTRGLVACALARGAPVGLDVEVVDRKTQTVEVADRFFSKSEAAALRALPRERQRQRFFELWTLKEAYIKARGLGLAIPLGSFSFQLDAARRPTAEFAEESGNGRLAWFFEQAFPTSRHALAVAAVIGPTTPPPRVTFTELDALP